MASWHYAFLFPGAGDKLSPAAAIDALATRGLRFADMIRLCVPIDQEGHLLDVGDEVPLREPFCDDVKLRLVNQQAFSVQLRNSELIISCFFAINSSNPHVFFGWPRRIFDELDSNSQNQYWSMIRSFAALSKAWYVVLVDDAPDDFEDRFIEIDGIRYLDTSVLHSYGHGIQEVWVNEVWGASLPEGACLTGRYSVGDGFYSYNVA